MSHRLPLSAALRPNRITAILLGLLASVSSVLAQPTLRVGSNTRLVGNGPVRLVYGGGALTNNGSLSLATGQLSATGPTTYDGSGTASVANAVFDHSTGTSTSTLNSLVSVTGQATLAANTRLNANGQLYLRTDLFPAANLVNNGVLTGNVLGLLTNATVTTSNAPFTSTLSTNVSGSSMAYQWQTSADNSQWSNVSGATSPTYMANVNGTVYYRCLLTTTNSPYSQFTPAVQLVANLSLSVMASAQPNPVCAGSSVALSAQASGGNPPYSYAWTAPAGATLTGGANTASATATVTASGVQTFTVTVTGSSGKPVSATVSVTVNALPMVSIAPASQTIASGGTATLTASGASSYAWSTGDKTAAITVMPGANAVYSVTGTTGSCSATATATVSVTTAQPTGPATLTITSFTCYSTNSALSSVDFVVGYSDGTFAPSVPNLFINGVTITGQLGVQYTFGFDANASTLPIQDQASRSTYFVWNYRQACASGTVTPPAPTAPVAPNLPNQTATVGTPFSYVVPAFSGTAPITYAASGLPDGLSFNAGTRTISGTPNTVQTSPVTITATNAGGMSSGQFTIAVSASATQPTGPATLTITSFTCYSTNSALSSVDFVVGYSDGTFAPSVPNLFINGVTITGQLGVQYTFGFDANQSLLPIQDQASRSTYFVWNYRAACTSGTVTPPAPTAPVAPNLPNQTATVGTPFSYVVPAFSGTAPITYAATGLPDGLSFNAGTRTISGTPNTVQTSPVTITATNAGGMSSGQFTIAVSASATQPTGPATLTITSFTCTTTNSVLSSVDFVVGYSDGTFAPSVPNLFLNGITITGQLGVQYNLSFDTNQSLLPIQDQASRSTYFVWNYRAACAALPSKTRLSGESGSGWQMQLAGNPVADELVVEVLNGQGEALTVLLTNLMGRIVDSRTVVATTDKHRVVFDVRDQEAGLLFLRASGVNRSQTLKVLKR